MATTYTAAAAEDRRPPVQGAAAGDVKALPFKFTVATALVINDIIELCKVPAEHKIVDLVASIPDLDTNGTPVIVLDIGQYEDDGTVIDVDSIADGATTGQAGGLLRMTAVAALIANAYDKKTVVAIKVVTAPATGATAVVIEGYVLVRPVGPDDTVTAL